METEYDAETVQHSLYTVIAILIYVSGKRMNVMFVQVCNLLMACGMKLALLVQELRFTDNLIKSTRQNHEP